MAKNTDLTDSLNKLCRSWENERRRYPGWLILHQDNRQRLWSDTTAAWHDLINGLPGLSLPARLRLLDETVWRLNRCLFPLPDDLRPIVEGAVSKQDPFAAHAASHEHPHTVPLNRDEAECWLRLQAELLRSDRERGADQSYAARRQRLLELCHDRPELDCRVRYEECLDGFERIDHDRVRRELNAWNRFEGADSFWRVRRAAVLSELGEIELAIAETEKALNGLRRLQAQTPDNIAAISREAWALVLLQPLYAARSTERYFRGLVDKFEEVPSLRDRWDELSGFKTDPRPVQEWFELRLERPAEPRSEKTTRREFDPGRATVSHHFASIREDDGRDHAEQFIRYREDAGYPPRAGRVTLDLAEWRHAAELTAWRDPGRGLRVICRTADRDSVRQVLTRFRVTSVGPTDIEVAVSNARRAIEELLGTTARVDRASTANEQLEFLFEVLSYLTVRLDNDQLKPLLDDAVRWSSYPAMRSHPDVGHTLLPFLDRVISTASSDLILRSARQLLTFPIPDAEGCGVAQPEAWPDPSTALFRLKEAERQQLKGEDFGTLIGRILEIGKHGTECAWGRAGLRLAILFELGVWGRDSDQQAQLGEVLWRMRDGNGIPSAGRLRPHAYLNLPSPPEIDPATIFRQLISAGDFASAGSGLFGELFLISPDRIVELSFPLPVLPGAMKRSPDSLIDWTPDEAANLLHKVAKWWDSEKEHRHRRFLYGERVVAGMRRLLAMLRDVVLPRLNPDSAEATEAERVIGEAEAVDIPTSALCPQLLRLNRISTANAVDRLRSGLADRTKQSFEDASLGISDWFRLHALGAVSDAPPAELLNDLAGCVANRRFAGLKVAMDMAVQMVKVSQATSVALPDWFYSQLLTGLNHLATELAYNRDNFEAPNPIPLIEVPALRRSAARLATALQHRCGSDHDVIRCWEELRRNDPLPEVRRCED